MTAGRRRFWLCGGGLALALTALAAQTAVASTYGGAARTGRWIGSDKAGDKVSFRINHRGFGLAHLKINAAYSCEIVPEDGGPNIPAPGGRLEASHAAAVPIDDFGETQVIVKSTVAGVSHSVPVQFQMGFTSHHQIPPPAKTGTGAVDAAFTKDDGEVCEVGGHGGELKAHPG